MTFNNPFEIAICKKSGNLINEFHFDSSTLKRPFYEWSRQIKTENTFSLIDSENIRMKV